jgi:hypothetical protein
MQHNSWISVLRSSVDRIVFECHILLLLSLLLLLLLFPRRRKVQILSGPKLNLSGTTSKFCTAKPTMCVGVTADF